MNNSYNAPRAIEIDLKDLMWKLLMQWKAILLVCIAMALLVTGAKHVNDTKAYKAALAERKTAEEQASRPAEERIADVLDVLPETDRQAVMLYVQMQESADRQQDYLDNSILMNENPASQRTLTIRYLLKSDSGTSMKTLVESYDAGLRNDELMGKLREAIDPDADPEYIYELVNNNYENAVSDYTDSSSAAYSVTIVLPEEADADAVSSLIGPEMERLHHDLDAAVGSHDMQKISTEDAHLFNRYAADRKTGILNNINNINNNLKNAKSSLSPEQQAAAESIIAIKRSSEEMNDRAKADQEELKAPGYSKKYALIGFLFGAFLYVGIYVVMLILKKVVTSANTAQRYTNARLLGEFYKIGKHQGILRLFTSDMVAKLRYKEKLDGNMQINAMADTVAAVCSHHDTDKLTLLLSGVDDRLNDVIDHIVNKCRSTGRKLDIDVLNADEIVEKYLTSVGNAVYVVCSQTKVDNLGSLMSLVRDYDTAMLGTIYLEEL